MIFNIQEVPACGMGWSFWHSYENRFEPDVYAGTKVLFQLAVILGCVLGLTIEMISQSFIGGGASLRSVWMFWNGGVGTNEVKIISVPIIRYGM